MHCCLVANGLITTLAPLRSSITKAQLIIAVDGGGNMLFAEHILPHIVIGDLDSLQPEALHAFMSHGVEIIRYPAAKDETDLELALLLAVERQASQIDILGGMGGRWDHTLSNVMLLAMPELSKVSVRILDGTQQLFLVRQSATIVGQVGDVVSLVPLFGDAQGVSLRGFRYPLSRGTLSCYRSRGISNVLLTSPAHVQVERGMLLVIQMFSHGLDAGE